MALADGEKEEFDNLRHLRSWVSCKSLPRPFQSIAPSIKLTLPIVKSVCVISALRLVEIIRLDSKDLSYGVVLDSIWTFLEPSLGIVNACLPVSQPVLTQISGFVSVVLGRRTKNYPNSTSERRTRSSGRWNLWTAGSSSFSNQKKKVVADAAAAAAAAAAGGEPRRKFFRPLDDHLFPLTDFSASITRTEVMIEREGSSGGRNLDGRVMDLEKYRG